MWSQLIGGLVGLLFALAITLSLYTVAIEPMINYDYESFYYDQDKSLVYTRSLMTIEQAINKVLDHKPFTKEQLIMLAAVDVDVNQGTRNIGVWQDITYSSAGIQYTSMKRTGSYTLTRDSLYNKATTFNSYVFSDVGASLGGIPNVQMNYMVQPDGTLHFFLADRKPR